MTQAVRFKNCFICDEDIDGYYWYHSDCLSSRGSHSDVLTLLGNMPLIIPRGQHYRYIRRIYLGKI